MKVCEILPADTVEVGALRATLLGGLLDFLENLAPGGHVLPIGARVVADLGPLHNCGDLIPLGVLVGLDEFRHTGVLQSPLEKGVPLLLSTRNRHLGHSGLLSRNPAS